MKAHRINSKSYQTAINRGIYEELESISATEKTVEYYKACGRVVLLDTTII